MRLVEISKFIGKETSLIDKLRDGGNLLISQETTIYVLPVHNLVLNYFKRWLKG